MVLVSVMKSVIVLVCIGTVGGWRHGGRGSDSGANPPRHPWRITPDQQNNTDTTAQVGGTARLRCYTHYLADEMVTWMKRDEEQLLTVGSQVYSSESRYAVSHSRHQKMWEFSIRDVRVSDEGLYECQLTTHPPASLFFWLTVVEARAVIRGGPAVHVPTGGRFTLHCTVHLATETPAYIFWFHNGTMVNFLSRRALRVVPRGHASSVLHVSKVSWQDAGTYTCEPHLAVPANMTVHVVEGEKHAALHNGQQESTEQDSPVAASGLTLTPSSALIGSLYFLAGQWGSGVLSVNT